MGIEPFTPTTAVRGRAVLWLSNEVEPRPALGGAWVLRPRSAEEGPFDLDELFGVGAILCGEVQGGGAEEGFVREALRLLVDRGAPILTWGGGGRLLAEAAGGGRASLPARERAGVQVHGAGLRGEGALGEERLTLTAEGASDPLFLGQAVAWEARLGPPFSPPLSRESVPQALDARGRPAALRQWGLPVYALRFPPGWRLARFLTLYTEGS